MHHGGSPESLLKRMQAFELVAVCLHDAPQVGAPAAIAQLTASLQSLGAWSSALDDSYFRAARAASALPADLLEHVLARFD